MKHGAFLLNDSHKDDVINHFLSLSDEERYYRFGRIMRDEQIRHQVSHMNWENSTYGIYSWNKLVGVAHLISESKTQAEFAISIISEYQGLGYGRVLLELCIDLARARGIEQIQIQYLSDNEKMAALASKVPGTVKREGADSHKTVKVKEDSYESFFYGPMFTGQSDIVLG